MEEGDLILLADGQSVKSIEELQEILGDKEPGDTIALKIKRGEEEHEFDVELKKRENIFEERKTRNDSMSGRYSKRRTNFPRVLQHDAALSERSAGGPLLNLEGKCVGMNIARVNRCETFAIPAKELREVISDLKKSKGDDNGPKESEESSDQEVTAEDELPSANEE